MHKLNFKCKQNRKLSITVTTLDIWAFIKRMYNNIFAADEKKRIEAIDYSGSITKCEKIPEHPSPDNVCNILNVVEV